MDVGDFIKNIITVAAGRSGQYSMALDSGGHVWSWGENDKGQLGDDYTTDRTTPVAVHDGEQTEGQSHELENIIAISAGNYYALALDSQGYVWAWGENYWGQLGNGKNASDYTQDQEYEPAPVKVRLEDGGYLKDIIYIDAGYEHSLVIDKNGNLWSWGRNQGGQLGLGTSGYSHSTYDREYPGLITTMVRED